MQRIPHPPPLLENTIGSRKMLELGETKSEARASFSSPETSTHDALLYSLSACEVRVRSFHALYSEESLVLKKWTFQILL